MTDRLELLIEPIYTDGELNIARFIIFEVEEGERQIRDIGEFNINTSSATAWMKSTLRAAQFFNQMEILTNGPNWPVEFHENHKDVDFGKALMLQTKLLKIIRDFPISETDYNVSKKAEKEAALDEANRENEQIATMLDLCDRFQKRFMTDKLPWKADVEEDEETAIPKAFIAHEGDVICLGDPNHSEGDLEVFKLLAELANAVPAIRNILSRGSC